MGKQAFAFNGDASYRAGGVYSAQIKGEQLTQLSVVVAAAGGGFTTKFPVILERYPMPYVESDKLVQAWNSNPMQFWQSQVNISVWCVTTGCGVSFKDHMEAAEPLTKPFTFHVYYQVRSILVEIQAPLPQDQA